MKLLFSCLLMLFLTACAASSEEPQAKPKSDMQLLLELAKPQLGLYWDQAAQNIGSDYSVGYSIPLDQYALLYNRHNHILILVLSHDGYIDSFKTEMGDFLDLYSE